MSLTFKSWEAPDKGALFVVTGASGAGKTTLVKQALRVVPGLGFSVSATTRPPRPDERDGVDYRFISPDAFSDMVEGDALLEWAQVYGHRYGTPRAPVIAALQAGRSIVLDIDHQGARLVREAMPEAVSVFVLPPSIAVMEQRLRDRSTDSDEVITRRMAVARKHLSACAEFDYLIVNDDLASAHDQFQAVLVAELRRRERCPSVVARFTLG